MIPALATPHPVAILELDEEHTEVLVMRSGEARFVRSLMRGTRGLPDSAPLLANELRQTLAAWRMQGGEPIEQIYVVGTGRFTAGLEHFFAGELGLAVLDLPPPQIEGMTPEQLGLLPRFAKAIALALSLSRRGSDLNLRQGPIAAQQSYQFLREKTPLFASLTAAIVVSFGFSIFAEMRALDTQRESLEHQLAAATQSNFGKSTSRSDRGSRMAGQRHQRQERRRDAADRRLRRDGRAVGEAAAGQQAAHDIQEFDYNRGVVKIQGVVPSIDDAHNVAERMGEHECFQGVKVARTTRLKQEDETEVHPGVHRQVWRAQRQEGRRQDQGAQERERRSRAPARERSDEFARAIRGDVAARAKAAGHPRHRVRGADVLGIPIYLWTELSSRRGRNDDIRQLLSRMDRASELLAKRKGEREALERRYAKPAPQLASFIESAAKANGLEVPDSADQPETKQKDFTERSTVVKMRNVGLKALVKMLERIETSGHPVAITQLNIKAKTTPDEYDVKLAVSAYDKKIATPKKTTGTEPGSKADKNARVPPARMRTERAASCESRAPAEILRYAAYPAFYLFCLALFGYLSFPYDQLKDRLIAEFDKAQQSSLHRRSSGAMKLEIDDLDSHWFTGIELTGVKLTLPPKRVHKSRGMMAMGGGGEDDKPAKPSVIHIDRATARAQILPLLVGNVMLSFHVEAFGGEIDGSAPINSDGDVNVEIEGLQLSEIDPLKDMVEGLPILGVIGGNVELTPKKENSARPTASWRCTSTTW